MALNPVAFQHPSPRVAPAGRVLLIGRIPELGKPFENGLTERDCTFDYAAGSADALRQLRQNAYSVVVTDPATGIDEDLALLSEIRAIRPGVRAIVLASTTTPEEVIAALRARVFLCKTAPFDPAEIAEYVAQAAASADSLLAIEVVSAHRDWISLRMALMSPGSSWSQSIPTTPAACSHRSRDWVSGSSPQCDLSFAALLDSYEPHQAP